MRVTVGLVDVGERLPLSLQKVAGVLNSLQTSYRFEESNVITSDTLGTPEVAFKYFEIPRLLDLVRIHGGKECELLIGVTDSPLTHTEERQRYADPSFEYFSRSDFEKCAVVSVHQSVLKHSAVGRDIYQYVAFLIATEVLIMTAKVDLNHDDIAYCVFNDCGDREALSNCIQGGTICPKCRSRLKAANVPDRTIVSIQRLLDWASRRSWRFAARSTLANPVVTLVSGTGVGWASSMFIPKQKFLAVTALTILPAVVSLLVGRYSRK